MAKHVSERTVGLRDRLNWVIDVLRIMLRALLMVTMLLLEYLKLLKAVYSPPYR